MSELERETEGEVAWCDQCVVACAPVGMGG